jgi:PmbA protein
VISENLEEDAYALIGQALECAAHSQAREPEAFHAEGETLRMVTGEDRWGLRHLQEAARELSQAALGMPGVGAVEEISLRKIAYARRVLNSWGLDRYLENTYYSATLSLRPKRAKGGSPLGQVTALASSLDCLELSKLASVALVEANRIDGGGNLSQIALPSGRYPAVLANAVAKNIMITAWQAFTGANLLSGASAFPLKPDLQVGSPSLSIIDDPRPAGWGANWCLDSEGTMCCKKDIVKQGRLVTPLHTLESAKRAGHAPTGNAGRVALLSGVTPINLIAIPSCIYIEPGSDSPEKLLERMGDGVYLTYSLDVFHSINISSGEFSIPCGGVHFRGGRPVGTVDQLTIAGNLKQLFADILAAGNDLALEEFMFYKNYCYGGPSLLLKGLSFTSEH